MSPTSKKKKRCNPESSPTETEYEGLQGARDTGLDGGSGFGDAGSQREQCRGSWKRGHRKG